jgi:hypothetical protein
MPGEVELAQRAFSEGKFEEAEKLYSQVLEEQPENKDATLELGRLQLYSNRLREAIDILRRADSIKAAPYLGEAFYRKDDFAAASEHFLSTDPVKAAKLASFESQLAYETAGPPVVEIPWLESDPLPLIEVRVNGKTAVFFIDTGGSEIILDPEFARELGLPSFGAFTASGFAGGKPGELSHSKVEELSLDSLNIANVPVLTLPLRKLAPLWGGRHRIDGVLGTVLLYHFLATMDYPGSRLVLKQELEPDLSDAAISVPFWMAGDHFMLAWGAVNRVPQFMFVDTGVGGVAWKGPMSTIEAANVTVFHDRATESSMGGGEGSFTILPLHLEELSLGGAVEKDLNGNFSGFAVEHMFDFRIGGMISHEFFKHYRLTIDFENMQLYLERGITPASAYP